MKVKITIEALNPVIISKRELIIHTISKLETVAFANLDSGNQYKFTFSFGVDESDLQGVLQEVKSLLNFHSSTILTRKEELY